MKADILKKYEDYSSQGYRTLGIAYKIGIESLHESEHESDMIFIGFITLFDPLKTDIAETIGKINSLGVQLKIITGDNRLVAANVVAQIGIENKSILTGPGTAPDERQRAFAKSIKCCDFAEG